jgi:DNA-binding beta-propeller fold protein YncE
MFSTLVNVLDIATDPVNPPVDTVGVGHETYGIAVSPNGEWVYAAGADGNMVYFDTATLTPFALLRSNSLTCLAFSPDGNLLYLTDSTTDAVLMIDVNPLSPTYNWPLDVATIGDNPYGVVVSPDGRWVYVANLGDAAGSTNTVSLLDATDFSIPAVNIIVGPSPYELCITSDGLHIFVTNSDGTISDISTTDNSVTSIDLGLTSPTVIAVP